MEERRISLMLDRLYPILKMICIGLGALLLYQCAGVVARRNPLADVTIPVTASASTKVATPVVKTSTNSAARAETALKETNSLGRTSLAKLPPDVQARVDRITQSEIFGAIPKPRTIPMTLVGIGGRDAFLRLPSGETVLLREGEERSGVKLLRIGTNRVLVESEGQQKELMIFSGFGGETLLPKGKEKRP